jgi:dihydropteroate synthase
MLSLGGDAAVARDTVSCRLEATDVVLMGTLKQIRRFQRRIKAQPFGLKHLSDQLDAILLNHETEHLVLSTSQRDITFAKKTVLMGILNVTPDSFTDGGKYLQADAAIERALEMVAEGADIIDVGGESSRPEARPISAEEELKRVIPVIEGIRGRVNVPVSVDTVKASVAQRAVEAGAEIINDISAMTGDPQMAAVVAETKAAVVLMHMKGVPETMQKNTPVYHDLLGEITDYLSGRMQEALSCGIQKEKIVVDPGIGFGKTIDHNLGIIRYLSELKIWGRPVLIGVSRKAFIGALTETKTDERKEGTMAAMVMAIMNGAHMVRVHDVYEMKKAVTMADAIVYGQ